MYNINFKKIIDITPLISEQLAVFPGDQSFKREVSMDCQNGDHIGLSSITTTVHIGAHADAPNHYGNSKQGIDQRELSRYMGDALVVDVSKASNSYIQLSDLPESKSFTSIVLFKTLSFNDPDSWTPEFKGLSPELIQYLADKGVTTVGIDTPSIDVATSKELPAHKAIAENDMSILEGLVFTDVSAGNYYLIALPLKIKDADASPVRAVLLQ